MKLTQQHLKRHPEKLSRFGHVRIWSNQWKLWWRKNGAGYTSNIDEAGVYSAADAWRYTSHCGPEKGIVLHEAPSPIVQGDIND